MSESERETERWGARESKREIERGGPQSSDKKSKEWTVLNGFSTLYYEDIQYILSSIHAPHALSHCSLHTLSSLWRYLAHPLLLSHKAFSTEPCRCSLSHRRPNHILTFQQTSLIIILSIIELRSRLKRVYLRNQISTIKTKQLLTLHNWVFTLQTYSLMLLAPLCGTYQFCPGKRFFFVAVVCTCRDERPVMFHHE